MKALKISALVFFSAIWLLGISNYQFVFPSLFRSGIIIDDFRYGDFYNLAHLSQFKEEMVKCPNGLTVAKESSKPIHFYAVGDSFLEPQRIDSSDFVAERFHYTHWDRKLHFKLDTSAINVVLLETIERHFRQHIEHSPAASFVPDSTTYVDFSVKKSWMAKLDEFLSSERIESQLSLLFTSNPIALKIKEWKSDFNYRVFNRAETNVTISEDGKHIVYFLDTDTLRFPYTAGFSTIRETKIDSVVNGLNDTRAQLLEMGFDHVFFSVIPNKSTIVMPEYGRYNHLIERVQSHPDLKTPFVSVIDEFRALGDNAYLLSDSHWTCDGRSVWLRKVNIFLNKLASGNVSEEALLNECRAPSSKKSLITTSL